MGKTYAHTTTYPAIIRSTAFGPLDNRMVVNDKTDLIHSSTFEGAIYTGMIVVVLDSSAKAKSVYFLNDAAKIEESDYSGWTKLCDISEVTSKESEVKGSTYVTSVETAAEDGHKIYTISAKTMPLAVTDEDHNGLATSYDVKQIMATKSELSSEVSALDTRIDALEEVAKDYTVTITKDATTGDIKFKQCGNNIGTIPADKVVTGGRVVKGTWVGTKFIPSETGSKIAIELDIDHTTNKVYINIDNLNSNLSGDVGTNITTKVESGKIKAEITEGGSLSNALNKVDTIEISAQVNKIEVVKVNNTPLTIDDYKSVNVDLTSYMSKSDVSDLEEVMAESINESQVEVTETPGTEGQSIVKSYKFKQFGKDLCTIDIPKDLVVSSGKIVRGTWTGDTFTESETGPDKALKLIIAGGNPVYINIKDLGHVYEGFAGPDITTEITSDLKIKATVTSGGDLESTITKVSGIAEGAQVNVIEEIKLDGTKIEPASKVVNIALSDTYATKTKVTELEGDIEELGSTTATGLTDLNLRVTALEEAPVASQEQSNWTETDATKVSYIKNKPENLVEDASYSHITVDPVNGVSDSDGNTYKAEAADIKISSIQINSVKLTPDTDKVVTIKAEGVYDGSTNKIATESTVTNATSGKVDNTRTIAGKALSADISKDELLEAINVANGAQVNVLEGVKLNGTTLDIDPATKTVNVVIEDPEGYVTSEEFLNSELTTSKALNNLNTRVEYFEILKPEPNVQSNWTETDSSKDSFIKNKPVNIVTDASYRHITVSSTDGVSDGVNTYKADGGVLDGVKINNTSLDIGSDKKVNIEVDGNYSSSNKIASVSTVTNSTSSKVDKTTTIAGVDLQDNITKAELLTGLNVSDGANVNIIEKVKLNGTELPIESSDKSVNIDLSITGFVTQTEYEATQKTTAKALTSLDTRATTNATNITSKVDKTTTIAGKDLNSNISKDDLLAALNVSDGANANILESVQINSSDLTLTNKKVNIEVDGNYSSSNKIASVSTVTNATSGKVDNTRTVAGKALSADITKAELLTALNVEDGANVNKIESISVNGTPATITDKNVDIVITGTGYVTEEEYEATQETIAKSLTSLDTRVATNSTNITGKVDKTTTIAGVDLQDNITKSELLSSLNVSDGAQVNVLEGVKLNGTTLDIDPATKSVNIDLSTSGFVTQTEYESTQGTISKSLNELNKKAVQGDWSMSTSSDPSYIKNKPENLVVDASYRHITVSSTDGVSDGVNTYVASGSGLLDGVQINSTDLTISNKKVNIVVDGTYDQNSNKILTQTSIGNKVDNTRTIAGKALSADITKAELLTALNVEDGSQKNIIEKVKLNGAELPIESSDKSVNIDLSTSGFVTQEEYEATQETTSKSLNELNKKAVQGDWNMSTSSDPSFIKNKPENIVTDASYSHITVDPVAGVSDSDGHTYIASGSGLLDGVQINSTDLTITGKKVNIVVDGTYNQSTNKILTQTSISGKADITDVQKVELTAAAGLNDLNSRLKLVEGGSTNVQSDWAESSASAASFIKNKPTVPKTYRLDVTSGNSITISNHNCGNYPLVQLYYDDEMVEGKVTVDASDKSKLTVSWSTLITPSSAKPVIIRIFG